MAEYTKRSSGGFGGDRGGAGGGRGGFGGKPRFGGGGFGGGKPRFGGGGDRGGRGGFGGGRPSFGGDRGPREMFSATCATCQKPCEVPFRPNGEKPVYCLDCFRAQNGEGGEGNGAGSGATFNRETRPARFERNDRGDRNGRIDRPSYDKPAHAAAPLNDKRIDAIKAELEIVNSKLDRLMRMMSAAVKGEVIETSKLETKPVFSPAATATISNSAVISEVKSPAHTKESRVAKEVKKKGKSKKK